MRAVLQQDVTAELKGLAATAGELEQARRERLQFLVKSKQLKTRLEEQLQLREASTTQFAKVQVREPMARFSKPYSIWIPYGSL